MIKQTVGAFCLGLSFSVTALADCGEPPVQPSALPEGSTATTQEIRAARKLVLDYSEKVDKYLTCMDQKDARLVPWLTKEQQTRREEDLVNLHNSRRDVQVKLNDAIRAFRNKSK